MWLDLIWTIVIYGLVFGILWWAINYFKASIPAPFIVVVSIGVPLGNVPLIPFGAVGNARIGSGRL